ncbi:MAG: hypothetical protein ACRECE_06855, partial [Xanthobacteraceae bacterium]
MRNIAIAGAVLAFAFAFGTVQRADAFPSAPAAQAIAMRDASPLQKVHDTCRCSRSRPARQYWRWDHRPIWDDPWQVLRPTIWGSPEPYLVPADIWARKWHLPQRHVWGWHHHP